MNFCYDMLGLPYSTDRIAHYSAGGWGADNSLTEALRLTVDGLINSITIVPYKP